jgi:hypothetical protein
MTRATDKEKIIKNFFVVLAFRTIEKFHDQTSFGLVISNQLSLKGIPGILWDM